MLQVEGISAGYGRTCILDRVSLSVAEGRLVTLIGPNGAGKTTLVKTILGLLRPTQGRVLLAGQDITHVPTQRRVELGIGVSPEGRQLFSDMTVYENLRMGCLKADSAIRDRRLEQVYKLFPRLLERRNQRSGTLSGGEQQMVAVCRALMSGPRLLILDEPTLGLAPKVVEELFAVIRALRNTQLAILLVEQYVQHSLSVCDEAYVLDQGRIVESGTGDSVLASDRVREVYLSKLA